MGIPRLKERPVLNSLYVAGMMPEPRSFDLDTLIFWVKRTPECIGIIKRIATDIVTSISFKAVEEKAQGRPAKNRNISREVKAEDFLRKTNYRKKLIALVMDKLITGDYYGWIGEIPESQAQDISKEVFQSYGLEWKELDIKANFDSSDLVNTVEIVPSSTMQIDHDEFKIKRFIQKVKSSPGKERIFRPEEIIHNKLIEIDGSVYGYSPMEASFVTIKTINSIQDFAYYYFRNGAKLDRAWMFEDVVGENFIKQFEQNLKQYRNVKRSHGDLVLGSSGKLKVESLSESEKDMQYRQLAIYSTGRLAFAFNMPADILSSILGTDIRQAAGSSDIEDAGYNRNIEQAQQDEEDLWNERFWIPYFKVEMYLDRSFKQDQIRVTQNRAMNVSVANFMFQHEYPVKDEFYLDIMNIPRKYLIKGNIKKEIEIQTSGMGPREPAQGMGRQAFSDQKRDQQQVQQRNNPPSGKELTPTFVSSNNFLQEAKRWGTGPHSKLRVRMMPQGDLVYLKFAVPNTSEELHTAVSRKDFDSGDWMNIMPIAVPAAWVIPPEFR